MEIVAGIVVFITPRYGSLLVALWLAGIVVNLLTGRPPLYYDIALRDLGLFLAALVLNRMATAVPLSQDGVRRRHPAAGQGRALTVAVR